MKENSLSSYVPTNKDTRPIFNINTDIELFQGSGEMIFDPSKAPTVREQGWERHVAHIIALGRAALCCAGWLKMVFPIQ